MISLRWRAAGGARRGWIVGERRVLVATKAQAPLRFANRCSSFDPPRLSRTDRKKKFNLVCSLERGTGKGVYGCKGLACSPGGQESRRWVGDIDFFLFRDWKTFSNQTRDNAQRKKKSTSGPFFPDTRDTRKGSRRGRDGRHARCRRTSRSGTGGGQSSPPAPAPAPAPQRQRAHAVSRAVMAPPPPPHSQAEGGRPTRASSARTPCRPRSRPAWTFRKKARAESRSHCFMPTARRRRERLSGSRGKAPPTALSLFPLPPLFPLSFPHLPP
jgi:hypothetical protein